MGLSLHLSASESHFSCSVVESHYAVVCYGTTCTSTTGIQTTSVEVAMITHLSHHCSGKLPGSFHQRINMMFRNVETIVDV